MTPETAAELLWRYGAGELVDELNAWSRVRVEAPRYAPPDDEPRRTVLMLDGIPGAGKSTTQRWLQPALGAAYFSMARFAEACGVTADQRRMHQLATSTPHPVDEAFVQLLVDSPARFVVLEKFPRSVVEAGAMLRAAHQHGWRFEVLHLTLPGDCVAKSVERQIARGPRHGRMPEPEYAQHRALVHLSRATWGRETLRSHGVPIHVFDMTRDASHNAAAIRRTLKLDAESVAWHLPPLQVLERVAAEVGADAWVSSGSVYRPFWNSRFGPAQTPTDVDVAVEDERAVAPMVKALERAAPWERWSVLCPATRLRERYGIEVPSVEASKRYTTFLHRAGLVRLRDGVPEWRLVEGVEASLRNGVVQLNARLLEALSPARRAEVLRKETHHLPRALGDYPGVSVAPETAALLEGGPHWRAHQPQLVATSFRRMKEAVAEAQRERTDAQAFCRRALSEPERAVAEQILRFHRETEKRASAPRLPRRATRPEGVKGLAEFGRLADDVFGDWFLEQVHHHQPQGGVDDDVRSVLDFSRFKVRESRRVQSPLHQGWSLERHLAQSVLELRTDAVVERLEVIHGATWARELRLAMRVAMLFHDTGKLLGERPRRHALISAALFSRFRPTWFPAEWVPMTRWMIRTHDLFGSFGRGLTDKQGAAPADYSRVDLKLATSYFGALDSQAVRAVLLESGLPLEEAALIHEALWRADVGSIAALRWLLPVAELTRELVGLNGGR